MRVPPKRGPGPGVRSVLMSQTEPQLPDPPPTWQRLLRLPRMLAREARWSAARRWRSLRWRIRHGHHAASGVTRAWARTDPNHMLRVLDALRARIAATPPAPPVEPPPPGTQARLTGHLSAGGDLGEWTLDERAPLEEAITGALGLDARSAGCRVEITVRVLGEGEGDTGVRAEHSAPTASAQQRPITADQFWRLMEIGAIGEGIELIDGYVVSGRFPFAFSAEAIAAARAAGIDLATREEPDTPAARRPEGWSGLPTQQLVETMQPRGRWEALEPVLLALVEHRGFAFADAVAWLAAAHDELDGHSPAHWMVAGGDSEMLVALVGRAAPPSA